MHNTSLFDFPRRYLQHLLKSDPDYKQPLYYYYPHVPLSVYVCILGPLALFLCPHDPTLHKCLIPLSCVGKALNMFPIPIHRSVFPHYVSMPPPMDPSSLHLLPVSIHVLSSHFKNFVPIYGSQFKLHRSMAINLVE